MRLHIFRPKKVLSGHLLDYFRSEPLRSALYKLLLSLLHLSALWQCGRPTACISTIMVFATYLHDFCQLYCSKVIYLYIYLKTFLYCKWTVCCWISLLCAVASWRATSKCRHVYFVYLQLNFCHLCLNSSMFQLRRLLESVK